MTLPPCVMQIKVGGKEGRRFRLWLPVFLFWPLLLVLVILSLVVSISVDAILFALGRQYHRYSKLILECMSLFASMRGLQVHVDDEKNTVKIIVK
jgi:hypothetical protein